MKYDLSVIIPGRNEMFISRTVDSVLQAIRGNTEIIVGLDETWADPPIKDNKRVTIFYSPVSIGQRAITNQCVRLTKAKYIMKLDAHCIVGDGFDVALIKGFQELGDNVTQIPILYNLHAFDWVCPKCGNRTYQGPTPKKCFKSECDGVPKREMIWKPRLSRKSEFYRFDTTLHFQYHGDRKKYVNKDDRYVETMSAQGSCFVLTRDKYWELDICDETHGSWGQQGTEVGCKTWLSGGKLVTNRNCWYSHMFRTQGGDFGFPYPQSGRQVENARKHSRKLFLDNTWSKQVHPLSWLIEKFKPLPSWHDPDGKKTLDYVNEKGKEFNKKYNIVTKGIIYYTNNKVPIKIGHITRYTVKSANLPIVSVSMKPMDFGLNYVYKGESGYLAYHRQILMALEKSSADIIFFCEHDTYYHPSHFEFTPPRKDTYYYNFNWWRVRSDDGHAIHYDTHQVNLICAYKDLLLAHYREKVKRIEKDGFNMKMGFEPGCNRRSERIDDYKADIWRSKYPCLDIRHGVNLTRSRWSRTEFRNQDSCKGWTEMNAWLIDGWDFGFSGYEKPFDVTNCKYIV